MRTRSIAGIMPVLLALTGTAFAQIAPREGRDAFGNRQADKPGTVRLIRPQDLPAPGPSSVNASRVVASPLARCRKCRWDSQSSCSRTA